MSDIISIIIMLVLMYSCYRIGYSRGKTRGIVASWNTVIRISEENEKPIDGKIASKCLDYFKGEIL